MPEVVLLIVGLGLTAAWVGRPLLRPLKEASMGDDAEAADARRSAALEALRDAEVDHRSGVLDDATYAAEVAEAERRAVIEGAGPDGGEVRDARRPALVAGALIGAALVVATLVPAAGVANGTVVNQALADQQAAEADRLDRIDEALNRLADDPRDPDALSDLADGYLAGTSEDDLVRAAVALRVLIEVEPERADAYERIVAAYLRAGDGPNARAALDAYEAMPTADPAEIAFLDGLVSLRLEGDRDRAVAAFDRFVELAPDDPRLGMVRALRDEADRP